jgi:carbonic anhydrase
MTQKTTNSTGQSMRLLIEGNARFQNQLVSANDNSHNTARPFKLPHKDQSPFCAILCCSDSRVSPEFIFDQNIGDLFVIRLEGNYASESAVASIEYAVLELKVSLIVVLGHSCCDALQATLDKESTGSNWPTISLNNLSNNLSSSILEAMIAKREKKNIHHLIDDAAKFNIHNSIQSVLGSPIVHRAQQKNEVGIIGAFYGLDTGEVEFI